MRHFAAIFFLLIFSFQILPVRAIGKLLAKNQQTEEVKDDCCDTDDDSKEDNSKEAKYNDLFHHYYPPAVTCKAKTQESNAIVHRSDALHDCHIKDIHCPPPNC